MATKQTLTSMNISLSEGLRQFVDAQVESGGFSSASEYVRQLIRAAAETADAEAKLLRALARGGRIEANSAYWRDKDSRVAELIRKRSQPNA